jgi:hypothetical protein
LIFVSLALDEIYLRLHLAHSARSCHDHESAGPSDGSTKEHAGAVEWVTTPGLAVSRFSHAYPVVLLGGGSAICTRLGLGEDRLVEQGAAAGIAKAGGANIEQGEKKQRGSDEVEDANLAISSEVNETAEDEARGEHEYGKEPAFEGCVAVSG